MVPPPQFTSFHPRASTPTGRGTLKNISSSGLLYALACLSVSALSLGQSNAGAGYWQKTSVLAGPTGLRLTHEHLLGSLLGGGSQQSALSGPNPLVWAVDSDGSWLAQTVGLGNEGTQVFTEHGIFLNDVLLYSAHDDNPPEAAWSEHQVVENFIREVASSSSGNVHVAVHQEFMGGQSYLKQAVLRKYTSSLNSAMTSDWEFRSPISIGTHEYSTVHTSADGSIVVLLVYDSPASATQLTVFDGASGAITLDVSLGTTNGALGTALSSDGGTVVLVSNVRRMIVDTGTGSVLHDELILSEPFYGALSISGDGALVATGSMGYFQILERTAGDVYTSGYQQDLSPTDFCRLIALSDDGTTCVIGSQAFGDESSFRLLTFDVTASVTLQSFEVAGAGTQLNFLEEIQCSASGERFAVGCWGDEDDLVPEVLVFETSTGDRLLEQALPGSVLDLDFSPDGRTLAVASKGVHATDWGGGGSISLYRVPRVSLTVSGVPHVGTVIEVEHEVREGTWSRVLVGTALADEPITDSAYGAGPLYLDPASIVAELPAELAGVDNLARSAFPRPEDDAPVGASFYLQAVDVDHVELSPDWVKLTILP